MTRRRGRSRRSYVVEFIFVLVLVVALWLFVVAGGAAAFGQWFATIFAPK
jgi:hypothetical protein